jgi:hypothetical protein
MLFTLRTEKLNSFPAENDPLPKQQLEIKSEFVYNQNLQLFISAARRRNEIGKQGNTLGQTLLDPI